MISTRTTVKRHLGKTRDELAAVVFMAETGEIACGLHAPGVGTDTFVSSRFVEVTPDLAAEWLAQAGSPARCEVCGTEAAR